MKRNYTKEIPQTVDEFIKTVIKECLVPEELVKNLFIRSEIKDFITTDSQAERNEYVEIWTEDINIQIELLKRIQEKITNWEE